LKETPLPAKADDGWPLVLFVDDDVDSCVAAKTILEEEGYLVEVAHNGAQALARLRAKPSYPSLILLDLMMPVMDGPSLLVEIQAHADLARIPVVLMTASGPDARTSGLPYPLLRKPFDVDDLLSVVTQCSPRLWDEEEPTDQDTTAGVGKGRALLDDATPKVYCLECKEPAAARCVRCGEPFCRRCIDLAPDKRCARCWRDTHP
jgi:CheY-like chemotaxis protein